MPVCLAGGRFSDRNWRRVDGPGPTYSTTSTGWSFGRSNLALQHFKDSVEGQHILVLTDNVAVKAHINCQGGTHSKALRTEAMALGTWAEIHLHSIRAEHITGVGNHQADWLSRSTVDHGEWSLHPELFQSICRRFWLPEVDLFTTAANVQVPQFFSWFPTRDGGSQHSSHAMAGWSSVHFFSSFPGSFGR